MTSPDLPHATRARWQPTRLGLVDLFLYDTVEFRFRDGHLLLRGNNGTGKSKVLALTLPFLLDGDLSASRVEPDGDPSKRMEWNLLLGDRYSDRLGYAWIEFGRRDEAGFEQFVTLGCGLKAAAGRGMVDHWFFVTNARLGSDFTLMGPSGVALSRERLAEALENVGHVYRRAEDYRRAIDERLFGLGSERYDSLIKLLIQLRQPQLTRRPDEERLSRALAESLRPVDQAILNVVAEAFHDLEQQRVDLGALKDTHAAVDRFMHSYRRYAAIAARRLAAEVRTSHSAFQASQREMAEARQELERAQTEDRVAAQQRQQVTNELAVNRGRAAELRDSAEVRELEAAERLAQLADQRAQEAGGMRVDAEADHRRQQSAVDELLQLTSDNQRQVQLHAEHIARTAELTHLPPLPAELLSALGPSSERVVTDADVAAVEQATTRAIRDRTEATRHLRQLIERAQAAAQQLDLARQRLHERIGERDTARDARHAAFQHVQLAASSLVEAWRTFLRSLVEIRPPDTETVLELVKGWTETLDGPDPASATILQLAAAARDALAELRAAALADLDDTARNLESRVQERERLLAGEVLEPPRPYTRDPLARETRPGAPLWQLVDFRPELGESERAGLEAALESAAILDAWVTPDGQLLDPETHDVIVLAGAPPHATTSLVAVLQPAIDAAQPRAAAVHPSTVERILSGIGIGPEAAETWVDVTGRWRLGVLAGCWSKPRAAFIGRGARDAARRARLTVLQTEIDQLSAELAVRRDAVKQLEARQHTLADEVARAPDTEPVRAAHRDVASARQHLARTETLVTEHERLVADRERDASAAAADRDDAALDLSLPSERAELDNVTQSIADYSARTAGFWPLARHILQTLATLHSARQQLQAVQVRLSDWTARAEAASRAASEDQGRYQGLRASIGATVEQIRADLEVVHGRITTLESDADRLDDLRRTCARRIGAADDSQVRLERSLAEQDQRRASAITDLQRFAANDLLKAALPQLELHSGWSPDPAVRLARRIEQMLEESTDADDPTWERVRREITTRFKELSDGLSAYGHSAILDPVDGWHVVSIVFYGQQRYPDELLALLTDEIGHRERLLNARERELLEEHLVNEIASHLQELIHEAEVQVQDMNAELRQRPTSTGMRLRFRWTPRSDGPTGLAEARTRLMRQVHDAWSVEDREAVSAFLKAQIDAVRTANETGTWLEHLTEAFDYRRWHRFTIERMQDGQWRSASGPASSGERVLTVTLPLFAAASAHYRSAQPTAPRLVLMDEVFAGVDDDSRSKSIGLLSTFDLDFVMTSEREWGCYPTLPGLAIYQLARREGIDAVHVTAWTWDGQARVQTPPDPSPSITSVAVGVNGISTNGHAHLLD